MAGYNHVISVCDHARFLEIWMHCSKFTYTVLHTSSGLLFQSVILLELKARDCDQFNYVWFKPVYSKEVESGEYSLELTWVVRKTVFLTVCACARFKAVGRDLYCVV